MNNNSQITAKSLKVDDAYEMIRHQKLEELPQRNYEVKDSFGVIFRGRHIKKATIKTRDATLSLFILNGAGEIDTRGASTSIGNLRPHIIARGQLFPQIKNLESIGLFKNPCRILGKQHPCPF